MFHFLPVFWSFKTYELRRIYIASPLKVMVLSVYSFVEHMFFSLVDEMNITFFSPRNSRYTVLVMNDLSDKK